MLLHHSTLGKKKLRIVKKIWSVQLETETSEFDYIIGCPTGD